MSRFMHGTNGGARPPGPDAIGSRRLAPWFALAFTLLALVVYLQYGTNGLLGRDDAVLVYAGRLLTEGVLPYASAMTLKGPLAQFVAGAGIAAAHALGWNDLSAVRALFLVLSALAAGMTAAAGYVLWRSARVGIFAGLLFCGFVDFARRAASGPRYQSLVALFAVLAILLTTERRWFWAGVAGALAYLTWQPSAVFAAATLLLAAASEPAQRRRAVAHAAAGIAVPVIVVVAVFAWAGLYDELALRIFLFDLPFIARTPAGIRAHVTRPLHVLTVAYGPAIVALLVAGLPWLACVALRRKRERADGWAGVLLRDRFSILFLTMPVFVAWSLFDFQGGADLFVLLPHVALGAGALLATVAAATDRRWGGTGGVTRVPASVALAILLLVGAVASVSQASESGLLRQSATAALVEGRYGPAYTFASIGQPQLLVLMNRRNPNPFLFIENGSDMLVARGTPGGFDAWLADLGRLKPLVVVGGFMRGQPRHVAELERWLDLGFRAESAGEFRLYVSREQP